MREIIIRPVLNGFVVRVGCQELVFRDIQDVGRELIRYQANPEAIEEEYLAHAVNKTGLPVVLGGYGVPIREEDRVNYAELEKCKET